MGAKNFVGIWLCLCVLMTLTVALKQQRNENSEARAEDSTMVGIAAVDVSFQCYNGADMTIAAIRTVGGGKVHQVPTTNCYAGTSITCPTDCYWTLIPVNDNSTTTFVFSGFDYGFSFSVEYSTQIQPLGVWNKAPYSTCEVYYGHDGPNTPSVTFYLPDYA